MKEFNFKSDILMEKLRTDAENNKMVIMFEEVNHALLDIIASVCQIFIQIKIYYSKNINKRLHLG